MKAMVIRDEWGPENIKPEDRPDPDPGPGEVVVAIKAVSINPRDHIMSMGGYGRMGEAFRLFRSAMGREPFPPSAMGLPVSQKATWWFRISAAPGCTVRQTQRRK